VSGELHEVAGLFRDAGQARMAAQAARGRGMDAGNPDELPRDADGVHVLLKTSDEPEAARTLLLQYGAYSAKLVS
jgi:hypothetical protein